MNATILESLFEIQNQLEIIQEQSDVVQIILIITSVSLGFLICCVPITKNGGSA